MAVQFAVTYPECASAEFIESLKVKAAFFDALGYCPHKYQWEFIHSRPERYNIQCWPRQHGKSTGVAHERLFRAAVHPGGLLWVVAPNYDLCEPIFSEIVRVSHDKCHFPEFSIEKVSERDRFLKFTNGARIICKSGETPESLQGRGLVDLTLEEWASMSDPTLFNQYLRPTLARWRAGMTAISTPKGFNQFFDFYQKGQDPLEPDWFSGRAPLGCSPYIAPEEIEEARLGLPDRVFRQEWEAEFVSDAGAVFRGVPECVIPGHTMNEKARDGSFYVLGIDLAKHEDYSVICVIDVLHKRQVYFDRFNEVDWHRQIPIFANVARSYGNCPVLVDSTGVGEPIYEFMRKLGLRVYPYDLHGHRKEDMINNLALSVEKREIKLMDIDVQTNELIGYEYKRTKTGRLSMSAPGKHHDDCVIALALAWWQATQGCGQLHCIKQGRRL